jgi:hypothetical protein
MYTTYSPCLIAVGFILLLAMTGSIIITLAPQRTENLVPKGLPSSSSMPKVSVWKHS